MIDQWLPAAVITAVNLLIMFGTMWTARHTEQARVDAQVSAARATGYAARSERAAGMQPGKVNGTDALLNGGAFMVLVDEGDVFRGTPDDQAVTNGPLSAIAMESRYRYGKPGGLDLGTIGAMMSVEVTEVSPGVLAAGDLEIVLTEGGLPKTIRRRSDGGS
jgi:hypothetical protein